MGRSRLIYDKPIEFGGNSFGRQKAHQKADGSVVLMFWSEKANPNGPAEATIEVAKTDDSDVGGMTMDVNWEGQNIRLTVEPTNQGGFEIASKASGGVEWNQRFELDRRGNWISFEDRSSGTWRGSLTNESSGTDGMADSWIGSLSKDFDWDDD